MPSLHLKAPCFLLQVEKKIKFNMFYINTQTVQFFSLFLVASFISGFFPSPKSALISYFRKELVHLKTLLCEYNINVEISYFFLEEMKDKLYRNKYLKKIDGKNPEIKDATKKREKN
jgi:uncharacterized protein YlbG (UPF0298 family)